MLAAKELVGLRIFHNLKFLFQWQTFAFSVAVYSVVF